MIATGVPDEIMYIVYIIIVVVIVLFFIREDGIAKRSTKERAKNILTRWNWWDDLPQR
jgi:uncharacterized oligopeptide transporter (OPT) family protein